MAGERKPASLRSELTGTILILIVLVVVGMFAGIFWFTIPALKQETRNQLSLLPFQEAQARATRNLVDLGQIIVSDNVLLKCVRRDLAPLERVLLAASIEELQQPTEELLKELKAIRNQPYDQLADRPTYKNLWDAVCRLLLRAELTNKQGTGRIGFASKADLLVITDLDATVLFELKTQDNREQPDQLGRVEITLPLESVAIADPTALTLDLSLVNAALAPMLDGVEDVPPFVAVQRYPDGHLYNMVAVPFQDGQHLLLLGERIDMRTAFHAATPNTTVLILNGRTCVDGYRMPLNAPPATGEQAPKAEFGSTRTSVVHNFRDPRQQVPGPKTLGDALVQAHFPWIPLSGELPADSDSGTREAVLAGESFIALAQPFLDNPRPMKFRQALGIDELPEPAPTPERSASPGAPPPPGHPILGWLVLLRPTEAMDEAVQQQQMYILSVGALAVILAALLAGAFARHITGPILVLARKMRRVVQDGDLTPAEPAGSREIAEASEAFNQMVSGLRQKDVLEKFVPEETRAEVSREGRLVLGAAQRVTATVMFSDLRGFTSLSERVDPSVLVELLGEYLRRMTAVVLANNGSIYEYIGDAILAVFRDKDGESGAVHAVRAALAMHHELKAFQISSHDAEVRAMRQGIGLNTGVLVDGNIGMEERAKRAVIGDVVNLAARIQDRSRDGKHTDILVSASTHALTQDKFAFEFFGEELFKGKSHPEPVWEVLDGHKKAPTETGDAVGQRPERRDQ